MKETIIFFATLMAGLTVFIAGVDTNLTTDKIQFLSVNFICWGGLAFGLKYLINKNK
jgi:hypothetical protein